MTKTLNLFENNYGPFFLKGLQHMGGGDMIETNINWVNKTNACRSANALEKQKTNAAWNVYIVQDLHLSVTRQIFLNI